jgi:hypothetical protein
MSQLLLFPKIIKLPVSVTANKMIIASLIFILKFSIIIFKVKKADNDKKSEWIMKPT